MTTTTLVFPVVLFIVLLVVQFALAYHAKSVATAAAQDGARAVQVEGGTVDAGRARASGFVADHASQLLDDVSVLVRADTDAVHVEVSGRTVALLPGLALRVRGVAEGPRERFRPEVGP